MQDILVLCTGNACRSIIAEALINQLGSNRFRAFSAGSHPTGKVHPQAINILLKHDVNPGFPTSKSWEDFQDKHFDFIITVCDAAAAESCPTYPGSPQRWHWSTEDPAKTKGSSAQIETAFERCFQSLRSRIQTDLRVGPLSSNTSFIPATETQA